MIVDGYSETNRDDRDVIRRVHPSVDAQRSAFGQSFTGNGQNITSCKFYLSRHGSPGGLTARLYAHTGTFGSSSVPAGSPLDSSDEVDASTISEEDVYEFVEFTGFSGYTLMDGIKYCIAIEGSSGTWDTDNSIWTGMDVSSPSHSGSEFRYWDSNWGSIGAQDACFEIQAVNITTLMTDMMGIDTAGSFSYTFPILWGEDLFKSMYKPVKESVSLSDYFTNITTGLASIVEELAIVGTYSWVLSAFRVIPESITLSDFITSAVFAIQSILDTITLVDVLDYVHLIPSLMTEILSLVHYPSGIWQQNIPYDPITIDDVLFKYHSFIGLQAIVVSDVITALWQSYFTVTDSINVMDYFSKVWINYITQVQSITLTDIPSIANLVARVLTGIFDIADPVLFTVWTAYYSLSDSLAVIDSFNKTWTDYYTVLQTITLSDYVTSSQWLIQLIVNSLNLTDTIIYAWDMYWTITQSLVVQDYYSKLSSWYQFIVQSINLQSFVESSAWEKLQVLQSITLNDYISSLWTATFGLTQSITLVAAFEEYVQDYVRTLFQSITIATFILTPFTKVLYFIDDIVTSDYIMRAWDLTHRLLDNIILIDILEFAQGRHEAILEIVLLFDYIGRALTTATAFVEQFSISDYWARIWTVYLDWPITAYGLRIFGYYTYGHDMIRPFPQELLLMIDNLSLISTWERYLTDILDITDYYVEYAARVINMLQSIILTDSLSTVSQFYRLYSTDLDLSSYLQTLRTFYRLMTDNLTIPDSYSYLWTVSRAQLEQLLLPYSFNTLRTWARFPEESMNVSDYLLKVYRFIRYSSLDIESYMTLYGVFYRTLQETTDITSYLSYFYESFRSFSETIDIADPLFKILSPWFRSMYETLLFSDNMSNLSQFYRTQLETSDISETLSNVNVSIRKLVQGLDVTDTLSFERSIVNAFVDILSLVSTTDIVVTWNRALTDSFIMVESIYRSIQMGDMLETLILSTYLSRYSVTLRDFIDSLSIQDSTEYVYVLKIVDMLDALDMVDPFKLSLIYRRALMDSTSLIDALSTIITHLGADHSVGFRQPFNMNDLANIYGNNLIIVRRVTKVFQPVALLDTRLFNLTKPMGIEQVAFNDYISNTYNLLMTFTLQLVGTYYTRWTGRRFSSETLMVDDIIISPVAAVWESIDMYLKRVTATVSSKLDEIQRQLA